MTDAVLPAPLAPPTPFAICDELTDMVVRDLLGPADGPEEELHQSEVNALGRYLVGMLAPKDTENDECQSDDIGSGEDDDEGGRADAGIPAGTSYFPSAMGLSFVLDGSVSQIVVQANWGQYLRVKRTPFRQ